MLSLPCRASQHGPRALLDPPASGDEGSLVLLPAGLFNLEGLQESIPAQESGRETKSFYLGPRPCGHMNVHQAC